MKILVRAFIVFAILGSLAGLRAQGGLSASSANTPTDAGKPRLAVVIVLDQMRPDQLARSDHLYTGRNDGR